MDWLMGKNRRKDREVTTPLGPEESKAYLEDDASPECLVDANFTAMVCLPHGVDYSEWLATNTISFFEHVNVLYGCVTEFCQSGNCMSFTGPNNLPYQWVDDKGKKCKCSASQYIDYIMSFSQKHVHDETVFPTKYGNCFPNSFEATVKKIHRLLLHVVAHVYQCHYQEVVLFKLQVHLNTMFYHFHLFNRQFNLVDDKEMDVLEDLFQRLHRHADAVSRQALDRNGGTHTADASVQTGVADIRSEKKEGIVYDSFPVMTMVT